MQVGWGSAAVKFFAAAVLIFVSATTAANAQQGDRVVASRGKGTLYSSELRAALMEMPSELRPEVVYDPKKVANLIDQLLLAQQVVMDDPEFAERVQGLAYRPSIEQFKQLAKERLDALSIADDEAIVGLAREYYLANPQQHRERRTLHFILVQVPGKAKDEVKQDENTESAVGSSPAGPGAKPVDPLRKVIAEAADIDDVRHAVGAVVGEEVQVIAANDLELAERGKLYSETGAKLRRLGEVSPAVALPNGKAIYLKLVNVVEGRQKTFDEVRDDLAQQIRGELRQAAVRRVTTPLGNEPLEINGEALREVVSEFMPEVGKHAAEEQNDA